MKSGACYFQKWMIGIIGGGMSNIELLKFAVIPQRPSTGNLQQFLSRDARQMALCNKTCL
jgi:hypothetical protein